MSQRPREVTITPYRDGPYLVRGPFAIRDQDGNEIAASRRVVALCRCGKSRIRPFCDGTHRLIDFHAPSAAERSCSSAPSAAEQQRTRGGANSGVGARDGGDVS
jgi:CDGSH-type Zn-finger protein